MTKSSRQRHALSVFTATAIIVGSTVSLSAQENGWTEESICGAGVYNYFFLKAAPEHIGEIGGWHAFRSASGGTYDCQLQGDIIAFQWKNDSGPMSSRSTRFAVNGDILTVRGDLGPAHFRSVNGKWSLVE